MSVRDLFNNNPQAFSLPAAKGTNGQVLESLGNGLTAWGAGGGGGGGQVDTVVAGNCTFVDDTDPVNPVVDLALPVCATANYVLSSNKVTVGAYPLAADLVWVNNAGGGGGSGTVTSVAAGTGLTASPSPITGAGTISLANTAVTAGAYTAANITVDAQGRITAAANGSSGGGAVASVNANSTFVTATPTTGAVNIDLNVAAPSTNGYLLSSTTGKTLSWVAPTAAGGQVNSITAGYAIDVVNTDPVNPTINLKSSNVGTSGQLLAMSATPGTLNFINPTVLSNTLIVGAVATSTTFSSTGVVAPFIQSGNLVIPGAATNIQTTFVSSFTLTSPSVAPVFTAIEFVLRASLNGGSYSAVNNQAGGGYIYGWTTAVGDLDTTDNYILSFGGLLPTPLTPGTWTFQVCGILGPGAVGAQVLTGDLVVQTIHN